MLERIGPNRMRIAVALILGWAIVSIATLIGGWAIAGIVAEVLVAAGTDTAVSNVVAIATTFTAVAGIITTVTTATMLSLQNVVRPDAEGDANA